MKTPKPRKRGDSYRIEFMFEKNRYGATFDSQEECTRWYAQQLLELRAGKMSGKVADSITLDELMGLYNEKVGKFTRSAARIKEHIRMMRNRFPALAGKPVNRITIKDITIWRNARLEQVSASTTLKDFGFFSSLFTYAKKELFIIDENPWFNVGKPKSNKPRCRRITDEEIEILKKALDYQEIKPPENSKHIVAWAFLFALETAMRRSEILGIKRKDIKKDYVHLPETKNDTSRNVPLSDTAKKLISVLPEKDPLLPITTNAFRIMWEKKKKSVGIENLHFHDTRHEAISRMVLERGLPVHILAKITGHKTINILVKTYYNPSADELAKMFNQNSK